MKISIKNFIKHNKMPIKFASCAALLILAVFLFTYCNGYSGLHAHKRVSEGQIKVACIGDSITYGHGISGWARNNYPATLQKLLGKEYNVRNYGYKGATVLDSGKKPYTESKQYKLSLEFDADILIIMLGTNDTRKDTFTDEYDLMAQYDSLIESYKEQNPGIRVILCTPPQAFSSDSKSSGETSFGVRSALIPTIRNYICSYAVANGYEVVDIYDITANHAEWFEKDGVHPSNDGARAIAEAIAKKILK